MSNFDFLKTEFKSFYPNARQAEKLALSDSRGSCFYARLTLEMAVHWLYDHDQTLRRPYEQMLGALIHEPTFQQLLPPPLFNKIKAIQKAGNQAAHNPKPVMAYDAVRICQELFHLLYWLARTYTRLSDPKDLDISFNPDFLKPQKVKPAIKAIPFTIDAIKIQEADFQKKQAEKDQIIIKREAAISVQAKTLEEREAVLQDLDTELAQLRAELATAKAKNLKVPDTHDYSELETRKLIIDLLLKEAGWTIGPNGSDVSEEYPVIGMPNQKGEGFVDYVLWGDDGLPLAVVEAKKALKDPHVGQQQAKLYADCLETMKGRRPVIFFTNGYETWLWDDALYPPRMVQGFNTMAELQLIVRRRTLRKNLTGVNVKESIVDRHYQKRVIQSLCEAFMQSQRKGLLAMATGTGKTRTVIALVELLMRCNWVKRVLFLADRVALVNQAVGAFKTHLPESSPVNLVTEKNGQGRVCVCTYPTMMGLIDTMKDGKRAYGVGHFDLVVIDEAHRSVYQKYRAIFTYFDSLLVGLTATPRDEVHHDTYHLFDLETGIPTDAYTLEEAVKDGFLVPPKPVSVPPQVSAGRHPLW
jgi:type I restriction enzyme R subunit